MTLDEAHQLRQHTAQLYWCTRVEYFRTYYLIYNRPIPIPPLDGESKGDHLLRYLTDLLRGYSSEHPFQDPFDAFVQSRWDESNLADLFAERGSFGYRVLMAAGWNPIKPPEEPPLDGGDDP